MSHNTWLHRLARIGARPLVKTPVTPNQITSLRLIGGIAAAAAFAAPSQMASPAAEATPWLGIGAGLFLFSMILDRADGELARLSGRSSPWGHKYDLVSDAFCNALAFVGLGIGMTVGPLGSWAALLGLVAGLAVALILWLIFRLESQGGERAGEVGGTAGFDPDDGMLAVPVLVWLGLAQWLLLAAAIGAPLFALYMFLRFRKALGAG